MSLAGQCSVTKLCKMLYIDGIFNSSASWVIQDNGVNFIREVLVFWWHSPVSQTVPVRICSAATSYGQNQI